MNTVLVEYVSMWTSSDIFTEDLKGLLEASDELAHITKKFVLMSETIAHFTFEVIHEVISLSGRLLLEILQEVTRHVSALSQHIVQIAEAVLPRLLLILNVCVHLLAFTVDVCHNLSFISDSSLFLFDKAVSDTLHLRSNWIQCIVVILDSILLFLLDSCLEFIPR